MYVHVHDYTSAPVSHGSEFHCQQHSTTPTISGDFRKEDLAAAVVNLLCDEGGQFALHMARISNVKHVIACGSFFNHPMTWRRLAGGFLNDSLGLCDEVSGAPYKLSVKCQFTLDMHAFNRFQVQPKIHLCKLGTYIGAIGCFCAALEKETDGQN